MNNSINQVSILNDSDIEQVQLIMEPILSASMHQPEIQYKIDQLCSILGKTRTAQISQKKSFETDEEEEDDLHLEEVQGSLQVSSYFRYYPLLHILCACIIMHE